MGLELRQIYSNSELESQSCPLKRNPLQWVFASPDIHLAMQREQLTDRLIYRFTRDMLETAHASMIDALVDYFCRQSNSEVAVAFSGGVDSTALCIAAKRAGKQVTAVHATLSDSVHWCRETLVAQEIAEVVADRYIQVDLAPLLTTASALVSYGLVEGRQPSPLTAMESEVLRSSDGRCYSGAYADQIFQSDKSSALKSLQFSIAMRLTAERDAGLFLDHCASSGALHGVSGYRIPGLILEMLRGVPDEIERNAGCGAFRYPYLDSSVVSACHFKDRQGQGGERKGPLRELLRSSGVVTPVSGYASNPGVLAMRWRTRYPEFAMRAVRAAEEHVRAQTSRPIGGVSRGDRRQNSQLVATLARLGVWYTQFSEGIHE